MDRIWILWWTLFFGLFLFMQAMTIMEKSTVHSTQIEAMQSELRLVRLELGKAQSQIERLDGLQDNYCQQNILVIFNVLAIVIPWAWICMNSGGGEEKHPKR